MKDEMLHSASHQSSFTGAARVSANGWVELVAELIEANCFEDDTDAEWVAELAIETLSEHGWVHAGDRPTENEYVDAEVIRELAAELHRVRADNVRLTAAHKAQRATLMDWGILLRSAGAVTEDGIRKALGADAQEYGYEGNR